MLNAYGVDWGLSEREKKKNSDNLLFYKTNIFRSRPARKTLEKQTSWRHTNSVIESSKIANIKVDVLSTYVLNGSIESKYIVF